MRGAGYDDKSKIFTYDTLNTLISTVPGAAPEDLRVQVLNHTAALFEWRAPASRNLNGELMGFKIRVDANDSEHLNFTLDSEKRSLSLSNLSMETNYSFQVAAYNRQGIGPFSSPLKLQLNPNTLFRSEDATYFQTFGQEGSNSKTVPFYSKEILMQEVWFITLLSCLTLLAVIGTVTTVCFQRKRAMTKSSLGGHYNGKFVLYYLCPIPSTS